MPCVSAEDPGFTAVAVLTLAVGIGATTALFSVVNAVLLRPLPFPHADRLLSVSVRTPSRPVSLLSWREYVVLRDQTASMEAVALWLTQSVNLTGGTEPERITGAFITASFFETLGLVPERGRLLTEDETASGRHAPFVVITHGFWQQRFGGSDSILNQTVVLNGSAFTVVGVLAAPFDDTTVPGGGGLVATDVFIPAGAFPGRNDLSAIGPSLLGVARAKPEADLASVKAELEVISNRLRAEFPEAQADRTLTAVPLQESVVGRSRTSLLLLLAAVGAVLLIACVNVSNLLLVRAVDRQREVALRVALGAGRLAVIRQLAVEAALLTVASTAVGLTIGQWSLGALTAFASTSVPIPERIPLDGTVLLFTILVSAAVAFICALVPGIRVVGLDAAGALQAGSRRTTPGGRRVREGLVIAELALSVALVAVSGLLLKSLLAVERAPLGFDPDHVFTLQFRLPPAKYPSREHIARFFEEAIARVRSIPGVQSAALVRAVPLSGNGGDTAVFVEGRTYPQGGEPQARYHLITPDYFKTMKIALVRGRDFTAADDLKAAGVAIVNQTLAKAVWPDGDAIGRRVRTSDLPGWRTVIGVVNDAKHSSPTELPRPQLYVSHFQNPQVFSSLVARTSQEPMAIAGDVRRAIWSVDKDQPVWATVSLGSIVDNTRGPWRVLALLLGLFAAVAVVIASVGVYGVMSYSVAQRTQEIGIRLALGASASRVRVAVLARALALVGVALVAGLGLAVAGARVAASVLVDVKPTDAGTLAGAGSVLALVAIGACYVPARRASRVDPMTALRQE